jgi:non-heme chloroperoxidase
MDIVRTNDGTTIAYRSTGSGPRDVLFVHGWMVDGEVFSDVVSALDPAGFRFIVPDLRGAGASGKPKSDHSLARHANDLWHVIESVRSERPIIVGHSMGGQIAQWMAADRPDRVSGLVLICPVPASGMALPEDAKALFRGCSGDRNRQGSILDVGCKRLSESGKQRLLDMGARTSQHAIESGFDAWSQASFSERLSAIRTPTLVLGTDDPYLPPPVLKEQVCRKISGARFSFLPGPGHYPQIEASAETAAILEAFLANVTR